MPIYIVMEVQNSGNTAVLTTAYSDLNQALAKYHTVLAAAAVSSVPFHACYIIDCVSGVMPYTEVHDRRVKPEPNEE